MCKDVKEMTAWETLKQIPNRIVSLIFNLVSRFGVMMAVTAALVYLGKFDNWYSAMVWIIFSFVFLYKDQAPDMIAGIVKLKELK